jgi:ribonuclease P/MRP protein subunit RPP1
LDITVKNMKFYDLNLQSNISGGESTIEQIVDLAKKLGYSGIAICENYQGSEKIEELKNAISNVNTDIEVYTGVRIQAKSVGEMKEILSKVRDKVTVVVVEGGDYAINRAACEDPRVDILSHPEMGRFDSGLDEPCLDLAAKNNVAIEINFREVLNSFRRVRSYLLQSLEQNIRLCEGFKTPMVVCSGAQSIWDMRSPRDMVSLANVLGMDIVKAFSSLSTNAQLIVEENTRSLEGKKISDGVEIVD